MDPPVKGKLDVQHLADHPAAVLMLAEALSTPGVVTPLTCMVLERLEVSSFFPCIESNSLYFLASASCFVLYVVCTFQQLCPTPMLPWTYVITNYTITFAGRPHGAADP